MGAAAQRLTACLVCCLLCVGTLQAQARIVKLMDINLTYDDIQGALDAANDGDVIQLASGELELTAGQFFQISKAVTLKGGPAGTTFISAEELSSKKQQPVTASPAVVSVPTSCLASDGSEGKAILEICSPARRSANSTTAVTVSATNGPVIIEGITFDYRGGGSYDTSGSASFKGIAVKVGGPSADPFSTITGCTFIDTDVGVELFGAATYWGVEGNTFDGSVRGVWLNSEPGVTTKVPLYALITLNTFTGFSVGVGCDVDDLIYNVDITYNTFDATTPASSLVIGIILSANIGTDMERRANGLKSSTVYGTPHSAVSTAALSTQEAVASAAPQQLGQERADNPLATVRDWLIEYNEFKGVSIAIEFLYSNSELGRVSAGSLSGVLVNYNSITVTTTAAMCPPDGCVAISSAYDNLTGMDATNNWYGSANPSMTLFFPDTLPWTTAITPYIRDYDPLSTCPTAGFCLDPTTIVPSTAIQPVISSVVIDPPTATPGSTITISITLAPPMFDGTVSFTSLPVGVTCPTTSFTAASTNPIRVTCTVPQAVAMMAQAAAAQAAFVQTAAAGVQYGRRFTVPTPATTAARTFTITVTVTATAGGLTATITRTLGVCSSQPWPFRADVDGCEGCVYDCTTGLFTCTSCPCHCPHSGYGSHGTDVDHPYSGNDNHYAEGGDSYSNKPYGGDSYGEKPYGGDSYGEKSYGGDEEYHSDKSYGSDESHSDKPYGDSHPPEGAYEEGEHHSEHHGKHHSEDHDGYSTHEQEEEKEERHSYGSARPYDEEEHAEAMPEASKRANAEEGDREHGSSRAGEEEEEEDTAKLKPLEGPVVPLTQPVPLAKPVLPRSLGDVVHSGSSTDTPAAAGPGAARAEIAEEEERPAPAGRPVGPKSLKDVMHGGFARAQIASVAGRDGPSVAVAAAWNPLVGGGSRGGYAHPDCSPGKPKCTCGPVPLTVTAQCSLVTYDACDNTLKCSSGGYGGY